MCSVGPETGNVLRRQRWWSRRCRLHTSSCYSSSVFVLLFVAAIASSSLVGASHPERDCRQAAERFAGLGLAEGHTVPKVKTTADPPLEVCHVGDGARPRSTCCTRTLERHLHQTAVNDTRQILLSTQGYKDVQLGLSTALPLRDELLQMLDRSANATRTTLATTYNIDDRGAVDALFSVLSGYVRGTSAELPADVVTAFVDRLFAAVVLGASTPPRSTVDCLAAVRRDLSPVPFDGFADGLSNDLVKSLGTARALLDSFAVADDVVRWVGRVDFGHQCSRALMRLRYCALCDGHPVGVDNAVRPCRSFCTNVARGCLVHLAAVDVGPRWSLFVTAVDDLATSVHGPYDVERLLGSFEVRVADQVGRQLNVVQKYNAEIASRCGPQSVAHHHLSSTSTPPEFGVLQRQRHGVQFLMRVRVSAGSLAESRNLFMRLPETFCRQVSENAETTTCWNGTDVGPYNRSVPRLYVKTQLTDNPEMRVPQNVSETQTMLSARLNQMTKTLHNHQPPRFEDRYYGSGGGYEEMYPIDDEDGYSGSGSGDQPITTEDSTAEIESSSSSSQTHSMSTVSAYVTRSTRFEASSSRSPSTTTVGDFVFKQSTSTTSSPYIKHPVTPMRTERPPVSAAAAPSVVVRRRASPIVAVALVLFAIARVAERS